MTRISDKAYRTQWQIGELVYNLGDGVDTVNDKYDGNEHVMDGYQDAAMGRRFNAPGSCSRDHLNAN